MTASSTNSDRPAAVSRDDDRKQPRVMVGLVAVNLLSGLAQIVQIGATAPLLALMLDGRGVDAGTIGLVAAAPWAMILLVSRFVPAIIARLGLAGTVALALIVGIAALGGMAVVEDPIALAGLNALAGIGLILRWIACDTWIVRIAPEAIRGRAIGTHETLMGLGIALGPGLVALTGHQGSLPFLAAAAVMAAAIPALVVLKRLGFDGRPGVAPIRDGAGRRSGWGLVRLLPVALTAAFACGVAETASIAFLPLYAAAAGMGAVAAPLFATAFGAGGTILQIPLGAIADRLGFDRAQALAATAVILGAILLPLADDAILPWLIAFLWGGAVGGLNTLAVIEAGARVDEMRMSAAMTAIAFCYTLGGFAGPAAAGLATEMLSMHGLPMVAGAAALVVLAVWAVRRGAES